MNSVKVLGLFVAGLLISHKVSAEVHKYTLDPSHTSVVFKVNHLGFSPVYGQFAKSEGKMTLDESKPEKSTFEVTVFTDSVNTHEPKRDKHLRSPDFFNSKQNPKITLKSKSVKKTAGDTYDVTADLTLNGVTKPVSFTFKRLRTGQDPFGKIRTGGETSFKIKRSDFKMNYMQGENQLSDEVELLIGLEGIRE